jgi:hypothetical protein
MTGTTMEDELAQKYTIGLQWNDILTGKHINWRARKVKELYLNSALSMGPKDVSASDDAPCCKEIWTYFLHYP